MIPATQPKTQPSSWQNALRDSISDPAELLKILALDDLHQRVYHPDRNFFPLRVTRSFVSRMQIGDPHDPLLRQILPLREELDHHPNFCLDAVGDLLALEGIGVIQKYAGRALLITTGHCAVHCRYCFRRHFPYSEELAAREQWASALAYLRSNSEIDEVLLSGGDPLSLSTAKLHELTDALRTISHVKRLRIHTRQPIVLPERVDASLLEWLASLTWPSVMVLHINHPNEIDQEVATALQEIKKTGIQLLNQAVLLRGVNDRLDTQIELNTKLFDHGVLPYYLHQLDRVTGTAHFEVSDELALVLIEAMRAKLPGYLLPRLVREIAGEDSKTLLR